MIHAHTHTHTHTHTPPRIAQGKKYTRLGFLEWDQYTWSTAHPFPTPQREHPIPHITPWHPVTYTSLSLSSSSSLHLVSTRWIHLSLSFSSLSLTQVYSYLNTHQLKRKDRWKKVNKNIPQFFFFHFPSILFTRLRLVSFWASEVRWSEVRCDLMFFCCVFFRCGLRRRGHVCLAQHLLHHCVVLGSLLLRYVAHFRYWLIFHSSSSSSSSSFSLSPFIFFSSHMLSYLFVYFFHVFFHYFLIPFTVFFLYLCFFLFHIIFIDLLSYSISFSYIYMLFFSISTSSLNFLSISYYPTFPFPTSTHFTSKFISSFPDIVSFISSIGFPLLFLFLHLRYGKKQQLYVQCSFIYLRTPRFLATGVGGGEKVRECMQSRR